ncbi:MAG: arsenate reductase family protein [Campylobacterales bacterium]
MIRVYGIPTCGSVKNALSFLKKRGVAHEFIDFRKTPASAAQIESWVKKSAIATLFNNKGTKYRTLGLASQNLTDADKQAWLVKENLLIKRPVIELENGALIVGYDEALYEKTL